MCKKIKILFIIDSFSNPNAGTEGQLLKLFNGLDKDIFVPHLVVFKKSAYFKSINIPFPVDILDLHKILSPISWYKIYKYLSIKKKQQFSLAHIFFNDASIICPFFLKLLNYKVIISRRDMGYWYSWIILIILNLNKLFVDLVITNSQAVKNITIIKEGYHDKNISVIYNGYSEINSKKENQTNFFLNEILINNTIRLVIVANIRPIKRISDAIKALYRVKETIPNIDLYVIGAGDQSLLIKLTNELNLTSSVHFLRL